MAGRSEVEELLADVVANKASFAEHYMCDRKVRYRDEQQAISRAKFWEQRHYICVKCGGYHLTSKEPTSFTPPVEADEPTPYKEEV